MNGYVRKNSIVRVAAVICIVVTLVLCFCCCTNGKKKEQNVSVMSWNVYGAEGDADACVLTMESALADVVCLQEVVPTAYEKIVNVFLQRNGNYSVCCFQVEEKACRTPILFNAAKLELLSEGAEVFAESYQCSSSKSVAWCVLKDASGATFIAANMHGAVTRNKYQGMQDYTQQELDELANAWRVANVRQAVGAINAQKAVWGNLPTFIAGDFNFTTESEPYRIITQFGYSDRVADEFKTTHVVGGLAENGLAIDHIFISDMCKFLQYQAIRDETALLASDHAPLVAKIIFAINA